ncbi:putative protein NRT1/ PTR FAMILY 6.4 [Iris pallida]|uniref:Uncharacterized protein n=1 Tax=Iris pallida TaxID=29817 RepID=A0AAX6ICJ0_IRIPA|nr:putative protein NRT1/ PTR FAMILY 6.4 [Iris pallida]
MGISMNMVTYLVGTLHLSNAASANIVTNFMGTLNLLALLAGFLADAKLGRYLTVVIAAVVTATGVSLLTIATTLPSMRPPACAGVRMQHHECVPASGSQLALLYASLYIIALGGGGIKANVSGFGSDQFDTSDPKEGRSMIFFFNRFYFSISLGSLFASTVLVYVQDNVGRGYGYGISAATMVLAVLVLLAGTPRYRYRRAQGSPLTLIWRVVYLAWKKRKVAYPSHASHLNEYQLAKAPHTERLRCLDKAAVIPSCNMTSKVEEGIGGGGTCEVDAATALTVNQVEEVKRSSSYCPSGPPSSLDRVLADDDLLGRTGHVHEPPHRLLLHVPPRLALLLPLRYHPPLHLPQREADRALGAHVHPQRAGAQLPPPGRGRPRVLHARDGHGRDGGEEAQGPHRPRWHEHKRVLARPAVLPGGGGRGLRVRGAARVLHQGGAGEDEVDEHGAVPGDDIDGVLPQQPAGFPGRQGHQGRVDQEQLERREAGLLLLDARGARGRQFCGVLAVCK